jgi:hypothetical protein
VRVLWVRFASCARGVCLGEGGVGLQVTPTAHMQLTARDRLGRRRLASVWLRRRGPCTMTATQVLSLLATPWRGFVCIACLCPLLVRLSSIRGPFAAASRRCNCAFENLPPIILCPSMREKDSSRARTGPFRETAASPHLLCTGFRWAHRRLALARAGSTFQPILDTRVQARLS